MIRALRLLSPCLLLATFGLGCQPPSAPAGEQAKPTEPTSKTPAAEPAVAPAPKPKPATGSTTARAYVDVAHAGVFVIDEQGWRLAFSSRSPVRDLTVIDDKLIVLTSFGVQRVDGIGQAEPLAPLEGPSYEQLGEPRAVAGDGERFWVVGDAAVGRFDGGWTLTPWATLTSASVSPHPQSLALDSSGHPWVVADTLQRYADERWAAVKLEPGYTNVHGVVSNPDGSILLAACSEARCALIRFVGDAKTFYEYQPPACSDPGVLALSSNGTWATVASSCALVRAHLGEPQAPTISTGADWTGGIVRSVAIDDDGRVWAGVGHTLVVVDDKLERYPLARLTEISGAVDHVYVTGAGPTPPTLGDERRGGLKATIVRGDQPLANTKVELCRAPALSNDATRSVCAGTEIAATVTTDADGKLEVPDLPLDEYTFAAEIDGRWGFGHAKHPTMRGGMTGNIGKIEITAPD